MNNREDFPPLPLVAFSHLGSVKVTTENLKDNFGKTEFKPRLIKLHKDQHPATAWATYWHEVVHLALFDAGTKLTPRDEERVCDALGTYLAAAVRSGFLKVKDP